MSWYARRVTLPAITPLVLQKRVIKVYSEDDTSRALEVPNDIPARDVCQLLILKHHYIDDNSWTLFEHLPHLGLERTIEDHEMVIEIQSSWGMEESRFYFRKNFAKYDFFENPLTYFPTRMVSFTNEVPEAMTPTETLKEPRYLQFFSEFNNADVYLLLSVKQTHGAPTKYGFCLKHNKAGGTGDVKLLCADDEESRTCWVTAIRVFKYGMQLHQNYLRPLQTKSEPSSHNVSPTRSSSENSLVAMDFSGKRSRVIENPSEALSVAVQEGLLWRRKSCTRLNAHGIPPSPPISTTSIAIHISQPWFHHRISRDEAQRLISQQGLVDGVFLLRDSQSNPKHFVLSLCHGKKIKHFQIVVLDDDGERLYTLDDGHTRFTDLIQLVEFYQLNKGALPCKLKHHCSRTTF
ncbi:growth factor receptor-bound protein 14 isoform X3 [Pleurodeles waltl]|uniref:growth factor receptor-bound protein 14 isoform X3 n=1 Tax=Pleurodeles waltl TaxID=8319 RepID=UPI003709C560